MSDWIIQNLIYDVYDGISNAENAMLKIAVSYLHHGNPEAFAHILNALRQLQDAKIEIAAADKADEEGD